VRYVSCFDNKLFQTNYKLVVVGDGNIGKTCLLLSYIKNEFPKDYVPTVFDNYLSDVSCNNQLHKVVLWDTAGQEDFDRLRPLSYPDTDVIVLCYAVNLRNSFENIVLKWIPEIKLHLKEVPIILVATKVDLRVNDVNSQMVTYVKTVSCRNKF